MGGADPKDPGRDQGLGHGFPPSYVPAGLWPCPWGAEDSGELMTDEPQEGGALQHIPPPAPCVPHTHCPPGRGL